MGLWERGTAGGRARGQRTAKRAATPSTLLESTAQYVLRAFFTARFFAARAFFFFFTEGFS